jgi:hypothetical protein
VTKEEVEDKERKMKEYKRKCKNKYRERKRGCK